MVNNTVWTASIGFIANHVLVMILVVVCVLLVSEKDAHLLAVIIMTTTLATDIKILFNSEYILLANKKILKCNVIQ